MGYSYLPAKLQVLGTTWEIGTVLIQRCNWLRNQASLISDLELQSPILAERESRHREMIGKSDVYRFYTASPPLWLPISDQPSQSLLSSRSSIRIAQTIRMPSIAHLRSSLQRFHLHRSPKNPSSPLPSVSLSLIPRHNARLMLSPTGRIPYPAISFSLAERECRGRFWGGFGVVCGLGDLEQSRGFPGGVEGAGYS